MSLAIDLGGKRALVAGVGDDRGFGFAIAKSLVAAGATVSVATWPPLLKLFDLLLTREPIALEAVHPFDADYDRLEDVPAKVREHRRYKDAGDFSIAGLATAVGSVDIVVHSLANGPEVTKPLLSTSRAGYLAAVGTSAYSHVALVQALGPTMRPGGSFVTLSYLAAQRVVAGYGGGMAAAKAALESDVRMLAFEAGRKWGHRVNAISAGPYKSRAAEAIGPIDQLIVSAAERSPLAEPIAAEEVATTAAWLASPLATGITGSVIYVDKGYAAMGLVPG